MADNIMVVHDFNRPEVGYAQYIAQVYIICCLVYFESDRHVHNII